MKKYFLSKNISLKYSGVRSYFKAFIKPNTTLQLNFDFYAQALKLCFFYFEIMRMDVLFLYLDTLLMGCSYDRSNFLPA